MSTPKRPERPEQDPQPSVEDPIAAARGSLKGHLSGSSEEILAAYRREEAGLDAPGPLEQ